MTTDSVSSPSVPGTDLPFNSFVGREQELQRLQTLLDRAIAGAAQVAFIAGEAGSGKSSLVNEFVRRAEQAEPQLVAAIGECNAQTGSGDPYLPFRQLLSMLTGAQEEAQPANKINDPNAQRLTEFVKVASATLFDLGPDLVGLFVPGASLFVKLATRAATNSQLASKIAAHMSKGEPKDEAARGPDPALDQERLFEQYSRVLQGLSKEKTLILILDDLQWSDRASLDLLFHLTRQLKNDRIFILGTYRPDDVAIGRSLPDSHETDRHPLESILNELKRYHGDIVLDIGEVHPDEGQAFVEAIIDLEPNRLGKDFRRALFEHTDGNPLFTIELLRQLQEEGFLIKDDQGRWLEGKSLNWASLPARVEGVIQERISRLPADLREILLTASVIGLEFSAQVVSRVQRADERQLIRDLSRELEKRYRLVQEQGEGRVGRYLLSIYRFGHMLIQQFLYSELSLGERRFLHADTAAALEELFQGQTDEIAAQLAHHYQLAGDNDKAIAYLSRAGDAAARAYAQKEAIAYYTQALALTKETPVPTELRTALYIHLGRALELDHRFEQAAQNYEDMLALAQAEGDQPMELAALLAGGTLRSVISGVPDAKLGEELSTHALQLAQELDDRPAQAKALWNLMLVNMYLKEDAPLGITYGEQSLALLHELDLPEQLAYVTTDLGSGCTLNGQFDEAEARLLEANHLWGALKNPPMLGFSRNLLMVLYLLRGKYDDLLQASLESFKLIDAAGSVWNQGPILFLQSVVFLEQGLFAQAMKTLQESIRLLEEEHRTIFLDIVHAFHAWSQTVYGDSDAAQETYRRFRKSPQDIPQHPYRNWVLSLYAFVEIASGQLDTAEATLQSLKIENPATGTAWLGLAKCQLAFARGDYRQVVLLSESTIGHMHEFGSMHFMPDLYLIKGRAHAGLMEPVEAKSALEQGRDIAGSLGSRRTLWQLLAALAEIENDPGQAKLWRDQSRENLNTLAEQAGDERIREVLMKSPTVLALLQGQDGG